MQAYIPGSHSRTVDYASLHTWKPHPMGQLLNINLCICIYQYFLLFMNFIADSMILHIELFPVEGREDLDQTSQIKFKIALLIQGTVLFCASAK